MSEPPPTRWALHGTSVEHYSTTFADLIAAGEDIDGEARLADALLPRGGRVLDVGAGMGRVSAALAARGHLVTAVEPDPGLRAQSRSTYPDLDVLETDVLGFAAGDASYDLVVCVGNVLVYLAEGTERRVLTHLASMLAPGGRILAGFHLQGGPGSRRDYPAGEFVTDVEASGLRVEHRFASYDLRPVSETYAVWVLVAR